MGCIWVESKLTNLRGASRRGYYYDILIIQKFIYDIYITNQHHNFVKIHGENSKGILL